MGLKYCRYCGLGFDDGAQPLEFFVGFQKHSENCGAREARLSRTNRSAFGDLAAELNGETYESDCFICGADDVELTLGVTDKRYCGDCESAHSIARATARYA